MPGLRPLFLQRVCTLLLQATLAVFVACIKETGSMQQIPSVVQMCCAEEQMVVFFSHSSCLCSATMQRAQAPLTIVGSEPRA